MPDLIRSNTNAQMPFSDQENGEGMNFNEMAAEQISLQIKI